MLLINKNIISVCKNAIKIIKNKISSLNGLSHNRIYLSSSLFDEHWFLDKYRDKYRDEYDIKDALSFYIEYGNSLGIDPGPNFSTNEYLAVNYDVKQANINALLHYEMYGKTEEREIKFKRGRFEDIESSEIKDEYLLIKNSSIFDMFYYLDNNEDIRNLAYDPITHFCLFGWKESRNPCQYFDIWQYQLQNMRLDEREQNPLIHYIKNNSLNGNDEIKAKPIIESSLNPQRCILFAGYDIDGIIDDYVIDYIRELAKFGDVFYLADSVMEMEELKKLAPYTKKAWAIRHGRYDFGSYALLANELVGWDKIEQYDEVVMVNDSCYLLKKLDDVFSTMAMSQAHWWGMQATKGIAKTKEKESNQFTSPIALEEVIRSKLIEYEQEDFYDFHIGSYFLVFRKSIIQGTEFRKFMSLIDKEKNKITIIKKYEIGLTRYLIRSGYTFDCYIKSLYPFHPVYSEKIFDLIKEGYPFFKRYLLTENHYRIPDLINWKARIAEILPTVDLSNAEKNLYRIAEHDKLTFNFSIYTNDVGKVVFPELYTDEELIELDRKIEKNINWWVFPVCAYDNNLSGNERGVFEAVKNDSSIKKIILTRKKKLDFDGINVVTAPLRSRLGQDYLLQSKVVFIKHTVYRNTLMPLLSEKRYFINLWHGIPLKKIGCASLDRQSDLMSLIQEHARNHSVIASSDIDALAMASAFYPLMLKDIWITGLPRIDFITQSENSLPNDFKQELSKLNALMAGRKLLLFCPTFKNGQELSYYSFSKDECSKLKEWLLENNYVLGIREHMAANANSYLSQLSVLPCLNLSNRNFPNIEIIYRSASAIITDYSSCFIDFMVTGKPMISFAYDLDEYLNKERGLFYNIQDAFAGPVCLDFDSLLRSLSILADGNDLMSKADYEYREKMFFNKIDNLNSFRLIEKVKELQ